MEKCILLSAMILGLINGIYSQPQEWGYHAGATVLLSEVNGANTLSAGMTAGVSNGRILIGFYGMKALTPAQRPTYESTLEEYGLQGAFLYPITSRLNLNFGLRAGIGEAGMEAIHKRISEGIQKEAIRAISPEVGVEFPLTRNLNLAYTGGYRWLWGAENLEDVGCSSYSSFYNALSLRVGFFPGR
jgi:hypothetical protein